MAIKYRPPRGYVESHAFQQDFDAIAEKYPGLVELAAALLWGIGENPLDFGTVPGENLRVAKTHPVLLEEGGTEAFILRVFFVVPESGPVEIEYLDAEAVDLAETDS